MDPALATALSQLHHRPAGEIEGAWPWGNPPDCPKAFLIPMETDVVAQGSKRKGVLITVIVVIAIALAFYVGAYLYLASL